MRLFAPDGQLVADSWQLTGPTYQLRDPSTQRWTKDVARALDRGFNALVGAKPLDDFVEPPVDRLQAWPEAVERQAQRKGGDRGPQRAGPDAGHFRRGAGRAAASCWPPTTTAPSPAPCAASAR